MKKTLFFGLIAASLGFTACSSEDDAILGENTQKKGMVLKATVEQPAETRATITEANWKFAFAENDEIKVTNSAVTSGTYYTFTNDGTNFKSTNATPASTAANWYAYYPSNSITLTGQEGTLEGVAAKYALAGTASSTTGADGLNITMHPQVAILKIYNGWNNGGNEISGWGNVGIQVKTKKSETDETAEYVTGMTAKNNAAGFDVVTSNTPAAMFTLPANTTIPYYVAVPAGKQISIKDKDVDTEAIIKSSGESGLTAGKYYTLKLGQIKMIYLSDSHFTLNSDNNVLTYSNLNGDLSFTLTLSEGNWNGGGGGEPGPGGDGGPGGGGDEPGGDGGDGGDGHEQGGGYSIPNSGTLTIAVNTAGSTKLIRKITVNGFVNGSATLANLRNHKFRAGDTMVLTCKDGKLKFGDTDLGQFNYINVYYVE